MGSKQPFEIGDFSGGITDNVYAGRVNQAAIMDNFVVQPDKKLMSRPGSTVDDTAHAIIPPGNQRIGALINYNRNDKLFVQSAKQFFYRAGSGTGVYSTLTGPASNDVFTAGSASSAPSFSEWNKQLFVTNDDFPNLMKIYKDGSNVYQVRNAGMPAIAAPTVTIGTAGTSNYVYAFHYEYTYTVGTQTFQELGPVKLVVVPLSSEPSVHNNAISVIPVLTNSGSNNYDTTVIRVFIYRTINNGTNFYKIGNVTNGTTTFTDSFSDASIQTNLALYTNDGTLDYDPPPTAKYVHVVGNVGFLGYTKDSVGEHPFRIQQSTPGNPNFWPAGFTLDVEDQVKGVKSVKNFPILLCNKQIFRIDGIFDAFGRGGNTAVKIHDSAGCISHLSCVEAEEMLYWCGNDGFYTTDGYKVQKISDHLNTKYANILAAMSSQKRIYGKFDAKNRRIYWCMETDASNADNDVVVTLDLRWGISDQMTFFTWSGASFRPTALEIFNDYLYRADTRGVVFKHDPTVFTDPKVNTGTAATAWYQETIVWTWKSIQLNFGGSFFRKFVSRCLLQAGNAGDTTIQISAINDDGKSTRDLKQIRWRRNFVWGDDSVVWRNNDCVWDATGLIDQWRRFPAKGLRLSYLQLLISNGLGVVANSDSDGVATISHGSKTAVLSGGITWPSQSVGYFLALENDGYRRQYEVSAINAGKDTITVLDANGNLPINGSYKWVLTGYQKGEPLNLIGVNLHWDSVDQNQGTFHSGDDGGNA